MGSLQSLNMDSKMRQTFIPDYSVRAVTDVTYIAIPRSLYLTAKKATLLEKSQKSGNDAGNADIDDEVEKVSSAHWFNVVVWFVFWISRQYES